MYIPVRGNLDISLWQLLINQTINQSINQSGSVCSIYLVLSATHGLYQTHISWVSAYSICIAVRKVNLDAINQNWRMEAQQHWKDHNWLKCCHDPYKNSTSGPLEGLLRPAILWRPAASQPLGGTEVGCKVRLRRLAYSEPTPSSSNPSLCLLAFCSTGFCLQLPLRCLLQWHRPGLQLIVTGWL